MISGVRDVEGNRNAEMGVVGFCFRRGFLGGGRVLGGLEVEGVEGVGGSFGGVDSSGLGGRIGSREVDAEADAYIPAPILAGPLARRGVVDRREWGRE